MNDISLIIPTHFRHPFLSRALDYYQKSAFKIYVVDSSKNAFEDKSKYGDIVYLHFPGATYLDKMKIAFSRVNTKYSFICADDDFISIESVKKCALYLEKNQDYSSIQGHYIGFHYPSSLAPYPMYLPILNLNISDNSPVDRLNNLLTNYMFHYYSVHRSSFLKYFYEEITPKLSLDLFRLGDNSSSNVIELANTIGSLINGKHRVLPIFYCARDASTTVPDATGAIQRRELINIQKRNQDYYENFVTTMADFFSKKHSITKNEAKLELGKFLQKYYEIRSRVMKTRLSTQTKKLTKPNLFKTLLKNILPLYFIDKLKNQIYKKRTNGIQGFPFSDKESGKQWREMKKVICRHDIDYSKSNKDYFNHWYY